MFIESRKKIVLSIMVIMTLLIAGTMIVIYFSSYREMTGKDDRMLEHYVRIHIGGNRSFRDIKDVKEQKGFKEKPDNPDIHDNREMLPPPLGEERMYGAAIIYSVLFDSSNIVKNIDNNRESITNDELVKMAGNVLELGKDKGETDGYNYMVAKNTEGILVAFLDRTNFDRGVSTLLKYTFIFGGVSLVIVFFISIFLANIIIQPLEKNHDMQKQFISDAGHELKTPLTVISTNAEVLSAEIGDNKWLDNIIFENEKMTVLIKQLLELTGTERSEAVFEKTDLSHLLLGEILPFESVAYDKGIIIHYNKIEEEIKVTGNAAQLGRLVSILMDNAIEHSTGEVIEVTLSKKHGQAVLTVANDAEPIPEDKRLLLFERFYRMDDSRNSESNHYGLGLSIAKSIVDVHKGSIGIECRDGKVIFKVTLKEAI